MSVPEGLKFKKIKLPVLIMYSYLDGLSAETFSDKIYLEIQKGLLQFLYEVSNDTRLFCVVLIYFQTLEYEKRIN